jgi:hypothetical protein
VELAFNYAQLFGIASEESTPYVGKDQKCTFDGVNVKAEVQIDGYERLISNDQYSVMWHLVNKGPLAVNVAANNGWMLYKSGVFNGCPYSSDISINHGVTLVGYGSDS